MFDYNMPFKWSLDVATTIYSLNQDSDTTWEYIYPQMIMYMSRKGISCSVENINENENVVNAGDLEIRVFSVGDTIGLSFFVVSVVAKQIIDEAYNEKQIFGLPVFAAAIEEGFCPKAIMSFMSRNSWLNLNTQEARDFDVKMKMIDRLWNISEDD